MLTAFTANNSWSCNIVGISVLLNNSFSWVMGRKKSHLIAQSGATSISLLRSALPVDPDTLTSAEKTPGDFQAKVRSFIKSKNKRS